jgi:hypothetical protein
MEDEKACRIIGSWRDNKTSTVHELWASRDGKAMLCMYHNGDRSELDEYEDVEQGRKEFKKWIQECSGIDIV